MRLVTVRHGGDLVPGRLDPAHDGSGGEVVLLQASSVVEVLVAGGAAETGESITFADADLAPVVARPNKIICVGVNYADHIAEMGSTPPPAPTYFAKFSRALIGARDDIVLPPPEVSTAIDWECELAIVIGAEARNVSGAEALGAIGGFCAFNDVSVRDFQRRTTQFLAGKTFEGLTPVGPAVVTRDEVGDGSGLALSTTINGEVKQSSSTDQLVFSCVDIVADLSRILTLEPGDIIATGTPGGVGAARTPPEWLQPGDVVEVSVEGVGKLINHCR